MAASPPTMRTCRAAADAVLSGKGLFDLADDPAEARNLAVGEGADRDLVGVMNSKLQRIMAAEFGADDGREMPDLRGRRMTWTLPSNAID